MYISTCLRNIFSSSNSLVLYDNTELHSNRLHKIGPLIGHPEVIPEQCQKYTIYENHISKDETYHCNEEYN